MCWKASAHYLQIWENTWVLYCSVLLLYSTNPESWNNKNWRCEEYKEITDGSTCVIVNPDVGTAYARKVKLKWSIIFFGMWR